MGAAVAAAAATPTPAPPQPAASSLPVLNGLHVGSQPRGSEAVLAGVSQWSQQREAVLAPSIGELTLYMTAATADVNFDAFSAPELHIVASAKGWPADDHGALWKSSDSGAAASIVSITIASNLGSSDGLAPGQSRAVRLTFQCLQPGVVEFQVLLHTQGFEPVTLWLSKHCGGQCRPGLHVGTALGLSDIVEDGKAHSKDPLANVDAYQATSTFFVRYLPRGAGDPDQTVTPQLKCVGLGAGVTLNTRAVLVTGKVAGDHYLEVVYQCQEEGVYECRLELHLKLWGSPDLHWRKSCGGVPRSDVTVDSDLGDYTHVFSGGRAATEWAPDNPTVRLQDAEEEVTFFVRPSSSSAGAGAGGGFGASPDGHQLRLGTPRLYSSDTSVLDVSLAEGADTVTGRVLTSSEDFVSVLARHSCKASGTAIVLVRIPVVKVVPAPAPAPAGATVSGPAFSLQEPENLFRPISFAYKKRCGAHLAAPFFFSTFGIACFGSLAVLVGLSCWWSRRVSAQESEPLEPR